MRPKGCVHRVVWMGSPTSCLLREEEDTGQPFLRAFSLVLGTHHMHYREGLSMVCSDLWQCGQTWSFPSVHEPLFSGVISPGKIGDPSDSDPLLSPLPHLL